MSKVQLLRASVKQRLAAAVEDIFGLFERSIAEYEEELSRTKEENQRQQRLLNAFLQPQLRIHRVDVQQLLGRKEAVPPEEQDRTSSLDQEDPGPPYIKEEQQDRTSSLDQEDPEHPYIKEEDRTSSLDQEDPGPPYIKEEDQTSSLYQEDPEPPHITPHQADPELLYIKEEQQGLEEADITKFLFNPMKSEDDEDEAQSSAAACSSLERMDSEEYSGGPGSAWNSDPERFSKSDTEVSDDWQETRDPQSALRTNAQIDVVVPPDSQPAPQLLVVNRQRQKHSSTAEHCCVLHCHSSSKTNSVISFHSVPADAELRRKWTMAIRRERFNVTRRSRVCSRHFTPEDFRETAGRRLLKKGVVPSLFVWNSYSNPPPNRNSEEVDLEDSMEAEAVSHVSDHDYAAVPDPAAVDLALEENKTLREEVNRLKREMSLSFWRRFGATNRSPSQGSSLGPNK